MDEDIIIANIQAVGAQGEYIIVSCPARKMTRAQALVHAAWLVALAERESGQFESILAKVMGT